MACNKLKRNDAMKATIAQAIIGGVCALLAAPIINLIPTQLQKIDGWAFPVVTNFKMFPLRAEDGNLRFHVYGDKVRDCKFVENNAYAISQDTVVEVRIEFEDDISPLSSRLVGYQDFGIWKFYTGGLEHVNGVLVIAEHACGAFWNTRTFLGEYKTVLKDGP